MWDSLSNWAVGLRMCGGFCTLGGIGIATTFFNIPPGTHGVANWSVVGYVGVSIAILGIAVACLYRWAAVLFSALLTAFAGFMLIAMFRGLPFSAALSSAFFAVILLLPVYLTYRSWGELRAFRLRPAKR